jgi:hypothetical protein
MMLLGSSCGGAKSSFEGRMETVVGNVKLSGKPAKPDERLTVGSEVLTGPNSFCDIVFGGKNIIRVMEKSDVIFKITEFTRILNVKQGGLESVLRNLKSAKNNSNDSFQVESSTAVASVRGTTFYVMVDASSNTSICACNGVVDMGSPVDTNRLRVESVHHTGFYFTRTTNGYQHQAVNINPKDDTEMKKLAGHNDAELEELAAKIGEKIDWTKVDRHEK